ncbi:hypothetical protein JKP88DRAFT_308986 [Tribonema minus]|uniref:Uncharacterized protein n=1 Tax=Tribonema minus TaxID=303371 RepID=A0A836CHG1_9STRA|nr:hypothetical protein JKP88DRAFT_308986 [Tribonema minus]
MAESSGAAAAAVAALAAAVEHKVVAPEDLNLDVKSILSRFFDHTMSFIRIGSEAESTLVSKDTIIATFIATDDVAKVLNAEDMAARSKRTRRPRNEQGEIVHRQCQFEDCKKRPSFAKEGELAKFCGQHRRDGDIDVAHKRRCEYPGPEKCNKHPGYGFRHQKARFCRYANSMGKCTEQLPRNML